MLFRSVVTTSTSWDLDLYPNDAFNEAGTFPSLKLVNDRDGSMYIQLNMPYADQDATKEVHLKYTDNAGSATADIYIVGIKAR